MGILDFAIRRRALLYLHRIRKVAAEKSSPRWIIFSIDAFISIIGVVLGYCIRFNFRFEQIETKVLINAVVLVFAIRTVFSVLFKIYAHVIRYTSIQDLRRVFTTVISGSVAILISVLISRKVGGAFNLPLSVIVMEFFFTLYLMVNFRLIIRYIYILLNNLDLDSHATIIIGSKELAIIMKDALELQTRENYKAVAFLDSNPPRRTKKLAGLNIYRLDELQFIVEKFQVSHLIIAKPDISRDEKEYIGNLASKYKIKMLAATDLWHIPTTGNIDIKEINLDELLNREPIKLQNDIIERDIKGKTILITGAAGSIGSELVRQIALYKPKNLVLLDQAESPLYEVEMELNDINDFNDYQVVLVDITNKRRVERVFKTYHPQIVYHAAAYKHVPMMEGNPLEAFTNNVMGSKILADLSDKYEVEKFVMVSTDKAVNPTNVMGATKRMAEIYIQSLNDFSKTSFITTRFGNVLNSNGSVIPRFLKQIKEGGPVTVTHPEITRFFMTIPEACQLVLEASVMGQGGEIFLFDMGKAVKILELAKNLIRSTGNTVGRDIDITFTGLRPGEKLYEELLLESEANKPTHHSKIRIADICKYNFEDVKNHLDKFILPVENLNVEEVVRLMKEMVPTYISKNSVFEKLDQAI